MTSEERQDLLWKKIDTIIRNGHVIRLHDKHYYITESALGRLDRYLEKLYKETVNDERS